MRERWPAAGSVAVRARRFISAAHYERDDDRAISAVPHRRATWALRELVVLHEIAHHVCSCEPPHGPQFVVRVANSPTR